MKTIITTLLVSISIFIKAQDISVKSSITDNSRYEIIQSGIGAWATFKIDKYLGLVYMMFIDSTTNLAFWSLIDVYPGTGKEIINPNKINYQLIISGIALRYIYLININTGNTWMLYEYGNKYKFEPMNNL